MAIESQGCQIRRQSTTADTTAIGQFAQLGQITFDSTLNAVICALTSWANSSFAAGMRVTVANSTAYTNVYTVKSLSGATMVMYEPLSIATASSLFVLTGHTFETIGGVTGWNGPTGSAAVIDITAISDTAGKQKLVGLRDEGQITLDINLSSSSTDLHNALRTDRADRALRTFDIKYSDNNSTSQPSAMYFQGYVTGYAITGAVDQAVKASLTLELTSAIRYIAKATGA